MKSNLGFAKRVATLRSERGFSKSGLARAVSVSTTCVWNWEEGNTHPRPEALARIAAALGTTPAFLERGEAASSRDSDITASETGPDRTNAVHPNVDDELLAKAQAFTGLREKSSLVREALKALIERESARRLARLGGSEPDLTTSPRHRSEPL
jgi:transcriptional regulator with XRE-family HTH domain